MKRIILTGLVTFVIAGSAIAQQVFRWVDSSGKVHYSSEEPKNQDVEAVKVANSRTITAEESAKIEAAKKTKQKAGEQQQLDDKVKQQAASDEAQIKKACEGMRKDLATYTNYPKARISIDGVVRRLTPEELAARTKELNENILKNCQDY